MKENKTIGIKIKDIKDHINRVLNEDLTYAHVDDATKDEFQISVEEGGDSLRYEINGMVDEVVNRLKSFMPNSSSVEVKKKCKLGGNPDGTSEPCNKGDINNLDIKKISENRIESNVGYFDVDDRLAPDNNTLFVSHLEIKPELRGQGHFKQLLSSIEQNALKRGKHRIAFDPDITQGKDYLNKLTSIYKHHGFDNDVDDPSLLVKTLASQNMDNRVNENHRDDLKYGVLMANFKIPNWKKITSIIDRKDVYDASGFGIEKNPHVTLLYGFHKEVNGKEVLDRVTENLEEPISIELTAISIFESKDYDVVKFDVKSKELIKLNKICKEFPFTSDYPDYHSHMTIAYVKPGKGKKYIKKFKRSYTIVSDELEFSTKDNKKTKTKIHESYFLNEKKSEFEVLKDNKKPLTDEERKEVMDAKAVWHFGKEGAASPAVWKSVNDDGDITYISNTHRAYSTNKTLKAAINKFHNFIKGTS